MAASRLRHQGFTLLEMAIVLTIIAVIMGGGAVIFAASLQQKEFDETRGKLAFLQQALLNYRRINNRIPCPANITLAVADASGNFGIEDGAPGACAAPSSKFSNGGNYWKGMIPTKSLKLPDDYAFDGWGRRITYIVDQSMTTTDAFITFPITDTTARLSVDTSLPANGGATRTASANYVLISHGKNGFGAYSRGSGTTPPAVVNTGSTNTDEQANCDCNASAAANATITGIYVQKQPTQDPAGNHTLDFDDLVVYATRKDLRSALE